MNHDARQKGSQGRSPASVAVNSNGSRGAWVPKKKSVYANDEHIPGQACVNKSSQVDTKSRDDEIRSATKQPDAFKISRDDHDLLKPSASSSNHSFVSSQCEDKDDAGMPSHLVNRVKHVSLTCKDSVSSTTHDKVGAHKSRDAGDSSNQSNTRPFDIIVKKTVMGLKTPLLDVNREKRIANMGYTGILIRPGMVHLKKYLSINDQVMIVNKCRQLGLGEGGFYQPGYRDGALLHLKMMCLGKNWDPQTSRYGETRQVDGSIPPKIPNEFSQLVEKALKESQSLVSKSSKNMKGEDGIPFMSPDICIANFYTTTGRLGLHQDKDESRNSIQKGLLVVSFSIGDSAEFLYSDQWDYQKADVVELKSGDVLIFGGKSRNVFHGVRSILSGSAPKVLVDETSLRPGRLNLTFRQY